MYPQDKAPVGHRRINIGWAVGHPRRYDDNVPRMDEAHLAIHGHFQISLQKKIKFIEIVDVGIHAFIGIVLIIIKLKRILQHILAV